MGDTRQRPLAAFKGFGATGLSVAVWKTDNGCSFTVNKRYKRKNGPNEGEWCDTNTLFMGDVLALRELLSQAATWASGYLEEQWQNQRECQESSPAPAASESYDTIDFYDEDIPF